MIVYILGFMGSGKSSTGKKLAGTLEWRFLDLDNMIEEEEGCSVGEIFERFGEDHFRMVEARILRSVTGDENVIVSCGGGTPCFHDNMDFMNRNGVTIYLEMSPEALRSRLLQSNTSRPLISSLNERELLGYIRDTLEWREAYYKKARYSFNGLKREIHSIAAMVRELAP